ALGRADEGHPPSGRARDRRSCSARRLAGAEHREGGGVMAASRAGPAAAPARRLTGRGRAPATAADYLALTHPRVQPLLLFAPVATMSVAGAPLLERVVLPCLGGSLSAGGAGAVNHYWDRDIDAQMSRTSGRPVPAGRVSPRAALWFGIGLAA